MMDNQTAKIVRDLRHCAQDAGGSCGTCARIKETGGDWSCVARLMRDAAERLEQQSELIARVEAERDAAIKDLNGLCWCCKHGKKWDKAPTLSKITTCVHMRDRGVVAAGGGKCSCCYWEWRGTQGEA